MRTLKKPKVPVIVHHSIGYPNKNWIWSVLTCPVNVFENQIKILFRNGFNTISLQELYDYMCYGENIPSKSIVLTFDDGYLDNWVYAYPILKRYGFRGTIYVTPEFIDPTLEDRPNLEHVWSGKVSRNELVDIGFLSWQEMKKMEEDGVMDIESHALTHTWYFNSDKIIDFRNPWDNYIWIDWNEYPEKKFSWMIQNYPKKYGAPVYTYEKSLVARRYFPDIQFEKEMVNFVKVNGGEAFFNNSKWRERLFLFAEKYRKTHDLNDSIENEEEYKKRVKHELLYSKEVIEKNLGKKVRFLCWPGRGYNAISLRIASDVGYLSSTSVEKGVSNTFGEDPTRIKRIYQNFWFQNSLYISDASKIVHLKGRTYVFILLTYSYYPFLSKVIRRLLYIYYNILFRLKNMRFHR